MDLNKAKLEINLISFIEVIVINKELTAD